MQANPRQILTFLILVAALSCVPYSLVIHTGHLGIGNGMVVRLLMWCPALAALATCSLWRINLATLGWSWRPAKYEVLAYALPFLYALPVYIACWITIKSSFAFDAYATRLASSYALTAGPRLTTLGLAIPLTLVLGTIASLASALGEEIGWRGFLLPRLTLQFGFKKGCFVSGIIWAVWHYPVLLGADYNSGTDQRYALACFTLMVIGNAYLMGWLRLKSGSLWPCAVLHATHNLFIQGILDQMTAPVGRALYVTTEFGAGMVITNAAVALILWSKWGSFGNMVPRAPRTASEGKSLQWDKESVHDLS